MSHTCQFSSKQGERCQEKALDSGYCFWHDPDVDKSHVDLVPKLEAHVRSGKLSKGLRLQRCNLKNINLVDSFGPGFDLSESDLYRADLQGAHLFNLKLRDGSLMKANLHSANLHHTKLENTNLLGMQLKQTRVDNIVIGEQIRQEKFAYHFKEKHNHEKAIDNFEQSEEIYRNLRKSAENQGLYKLVGEFYYRELIMRRSQLDKWSFEWCFSKLADLLCGYGEKPANIVVFSLFLIFACSLLYFFFGVAHGDSLIQFDSSLSAEQNISHFGMSIYYSVVTFTTLGYGDVTPMGVTRFIAALEAFIGSFTIALYVVVFVKRMGR